MSHGHVCGRQSVDLDGEAADVGFVLKVDGQHRLWRVVHLRRAEVAGRALDEALEARSAGLVYLHLDPGYAPLRSDPRFTTLVKKIGLT